MDQDKPDDGEEAPAKTVSRRGFMKYGIAVVGGAIWLVSRATLISQTGGETNGAFTAAAYVTDQVPPGVVSSHFHWPKSPANSVVPANTKLQPINQRYQFKLGKGRVRKIGTTKLSETFPFVPRNLA